jgi:hypothetical protein
MHLAVEAAKDAASTYHTTHANQLSVPAVMNEATKLRGVASQAEHHLQSAESDVGRLIRERAHLDEMLNCDAHIAEADAAIAPARADVAQAATALAAAATVLVEVQTLLAGEQHANEMATTQAANELLDALRTGRKATSCKSNHGHLDALQQAYVTATTDVQAAQSELDRVQGLLDDLLHERLQTQTSQTERDLHLAAWAYAGALVLHEAACWAVRSHFAAPDVDLMTREVKRGLDGVGDPGGPIQTTRGAEAL